MNEGVNKKHMLCVLFQKSCVIEQGLCVLCGGEYDNIWPLVVNQGCYQRHLTEVHLLSLTHCPKHSNPSFSPLLLPPLEPSSGKSVKLEVGEDKSIKRHSFPPSEVAIGLSPYTFPQEESFHVPKEKYMAGQGCAWEDRTPHPPQLLQKKGLFSDTWRQASPPRDKRKRQSPQAQAAFQRQSCKVHQARQMAALPWKPAKQVLRIKRATFPKELLKQCKATKWIV